MKQAEDISTFHLELETLGSSSEALRVKLISGPDSDEESETHVIDNPLHKQFVSDIELGRALYECLFGSKENPNEIGQRLSKYYNEKCANQLDNQVCIRLLLKFSSTKKRPEPAISLPWELLHDGQKWLGRDPRISIARRTTFKSNSPQKNDSSLRVLLAYAEPKVLTQFDGEEHLKKIAKAIGESTWLDLVLLPKANRLTLKEKLKEGFHIFHFLGHGEAESSAEVGLNAYLHLESSHYQDKSERVSALDFAEWFKEAKISPQLVVLTACQSSITNCFSALGTAQALLDSGIPAVVAMQANLRIPEALLFAQAFYKQIANHTTVDDALQAGRKALDPLTTRSKQRGVEEQVIRLLKPPTLSDTGKVFEIDTAQESLGNTLKDQTVRFPAWAIPVLLLNGDSRLGLEPPPQKICWKLEKIFCEMVYIPEGNFYIDKYPVTYAAYQEFNVQLSNPHFKENSSEDFDNYPVTRVSIEQAREFAHWTGRRLPLVEEWQQAALSGIPDKYQRYTWGNQVRQNSCNTLESGRNPLSPMSVIEEADCYKGNTNPSGMCGIIGNVAEFAEDNAGEIRLCGGTYITKLESISIKQALPAAKGLFKTVGFRCIADWQAIKVAQREGRLSIPLSASCS
ncbi:CHAT domain-containing protein [Nostoc sp. UIC 10607]|uniref:CHAT domain-containing protein n=1 Tax=Nostoc sp. UIC 10607 TaxID=3045935 RepID=UPI0039A03308